MAKLIPLLLLAMTIRSLVASEPAQFVFERGDSVWIANIDGSKPKKLVKGADPRVSPDGTRVAFTQDFEGKEPVNRRIAVFDLATQKTTIFKDVPSNNAYGPVWSPDGSKIVFYMFGDKDWHVCMTNADGSGFAYLFKTPPEGHAKYSVAWAPDGKSLFCQDLDTLFRIDLDGKTLLQTPLKEILGDATLNSGSEFAPSPDGKSLLIDADMDEQEIKGWDGPPAALLLVDIETKKLTRLSPKKFNAWNPCWLNDQEILFVGQGEGEKGPSVYRMAIAGGARKKLLQNG